MLPSVVPRLMTDSAVRVFPGVWKLLSFKNSLPGTELHPGKGVLKREVSKHQETLSLPSLCRALEAQRAT